MSEKRKKVEFGNQTLKEIFPPEREDINKIKSGMKRFRRKSNESRDI